MKPADDGITVKSLRVERKKIDRGEQLVLKGEPGRETVLHLLRGSGRFQLGGVGDDSLPWWRPGVFDCGSLTVVLSPGDSVILTGRLDLLVASVDNPSPPATQVHRGHTIHSIGEGNHFREVREIIGADAKLGRIRLGETVQAPGNWSSWPMHDFEKDEKNTKGFEEVFFYVTKPRDGFAIQMRRGAYCDGGRSGDLFTEVRSGDMLSIPLGEHPVVAAPNTELYYCWIYVSPVDKHYAKWAEDVEGYA